MSEEGALSPTKQALIALKTLQGRLDESERARREPLAIIGMGCRFPGGAETPAQFWAGLCAGADGVREVPPDRWAIDHYYDADPDAPGKMYCRSGAFLDDVAGFDAGFFGISPREALTMDPQQRLLLEVAWEALEDANVVAGSLYQKATGVFLGISTNDYFRRIPTLAALEAHVGTGNSLSVAAGRLSYWLGLTGPSMAVDTACSSSLVALHLACQSLRQRECEMALVGGVNLILSPEGHIIFSRSRMLAPDGRCKPFDATADGYGRGEGCAVLLLKRLSDAQAAGDRILALVRGTAVNQNGPSGGLGVPSGPAQEQVIRQALANGGVAPDEVGYVEAHSVGALLSDPIEVGALAAVFGVRTEPLLLGSLKGNVGHQEAAAGVAGLVKVIQALQARELPPTLHFRTPNPYIEWERVPVRVVTTRTPWATGPRLAGVSSFGFGGTNAHAILEAAPPVAERAPAPASAPVLLCLAARHAESLPVLAERYAESLAAENAPALADVAYTSQVGRSHGTQRVALVVRTRAEAVARLRALAAGESVSPAATQPDEAELLTLARRYEAGEELPWESLAPTLCPDARKVPLPLTPWQRQRYWLETPAPAAPDAPPEATSNGHAAPRPLVGRVAARMRGWLRPPAPRTTGNGHHAPALRPFEATWEETPPAQRPTVLEARLQAETAAVLGLRPDELDPHQPLHALGLDSLLAVQLRTRMQAGLGVAVPMMLFLQNPSVAQLATALLPHLDAEAQPGEEAGASPLVALRTGGARTPLFLVHPWGGLAYPYQELAARLEPEQPVYGLQAVGLYQTPDRTIEAMAQRYVRAVRQQQPHGPYRLGGWSFGALVAYEMAQLLAQAGERVEFLAMMDIYAPLYGEENSTMDWVRYWGDTVTRYIWPYVQDYLVLANTGAGPRQGERALPLWQAARTLAEEMRGLTVPDSFIRRVLALLQTNSRALAHYYPQPYPGRLWLFRVEEAEARFTDPTWGWAELAWEGVEVLPIRGNHLTFLTAPEVAGLAEAITGALRALERERVAHG